MQNIHFFKYQGTGNDFLIFDNRNDQFFPSTVQIKAWCQRKYGVGSDGLIVIEASENHDFKMLFYNPDGSESFCGNGARCAVQFACDNQFFESGSTFEAVDGVHSATVQEMEVSISMGQVKLVEEIDGAFFANTGAPHFVVPTKEVAALHIEKEAKPFRYHSSQLPIGSNVNFMEQVEDGIRIRTFEKGVEKETLSCGTGITAAALAAHAIGWVKETVDVHSLGGILQVKFTSTEKDGYTNIFLSGPATFVFEGYVNH
jgi:diaminopimelate epimerase